jgi:hypothetical protein
LPRSSGPGCPPHAFPQELSMTTNNGLPLKGTELTEGSKGVDWRIA